jgi:radical SAM superfamily enzyme YgiQ (UPF0313 family)
MKILVVSANTLPASPAGSGFDYFDPNWLEYLDLDYGLYGEADHAIPLFLERLESGGEIYSVPGCIYRTRLNRLGG